MAETKPKTNKRKKKKRISFIPALICVLIMTAGIIFFFYYQKTTLLKSFDGSFTRNEDITDSVITNAAIWLSDIEGISLNEEWIASKADRIVLDITLIVTPTATGAGDYVIELDQDSYNDCFAMSYALVGNCLKEVIANRLIAAGYSEDMDEAEVTALTTEILGMTLEEYLIDKELVLIPQYEDLAAKYSETGTYTIKNDSITINSAEGERIESFLYNENAFSLPDLGLTYRKVVEP